MTLTPGIAILSCCVAVRALQFLRNLVQGFLRAPAFADLQLQPRIGRNQLAGALLDQQLELVAVLSQFPFGLEPMDGLGNQWRHRFQEFNRPGGKPPWPRIGQVQRAKDLIAVAQGMTATEVKPNLMQVPR